MEKKSLETKKTIKKLLVANRGEIAVRILRAAKELNIETVAIYGEPDEGALHVRLADSAVALRGKAARDTYLQQEKVLEAALMSGADAIHPGYGFLSENAAFAQAIAREGLIFVGPRPEVIELMGDKHRARIQAKKAGVPLLPGTSSFVPGSASTASSEGSTEAVFALGKRAGYPLIVKAVAGGSGRGMRIVNSEEEVPAKLEEASREASAGFGNGAVYVEKYLSRPRHIEVQLFGDMHGSLLHFGERECSIQRRHQKLLEECPAPALHPVVRANLHRAALELARSVQYSSAGTAEFLVDGGTMPESPFYFLEMNTRIQVEHPVSEMTSGVDLVSLQLLVAQGGHLPYRQENIVLRGHALELRVYAESPAHDFQPTSGEITYVSRGGGAGYREDSWIEAGTRVSAYYDALLAKLIFWGETREQTILKAQQAVDAFVIDGPETTLGFHRWFTRQPAFVSAGMIDVAWLAREYRGETLPPRAVGPLVLPPAKEAAIKAKRG